MTHKFLLWAGPSVVVFVGGCFALFAALASTYSGVNKWGETQFDVWWPTVTAPWFLVVSAVVICAYIWALVFTGREAPNAITTRQNELFRCLATELAKYMNLADRFPIGKAWGENATNQALEQWHSARKNLQVIIKEISYDSDTSRTLVDLMQLCDGIVSDAQYGENPREDRQAAREIVAPIFRYLHQGRSIDRDKIPLLDWMKA